jgi:hypothetical protein
LSRPSKTPGSEEVPLLAIALITGLALAESAGTLPAGSAVAYGGLALGSFQYGSSGLIRDRQLRARADLYGAVGLTDRLQLSLDAPVMRTWVLELEDRGPCPTDGYEGDYCDPVTGVGEAGLHARYRVASGLVVGAGVRSDAWNAGTRQRWTNIGLGTTSLVGSLIVGRERERLGVVGAAHYRLTLGRAVDAGLGEVSLPGDTVAGLVELRYSPPQIRPEFRLALSGMSRLWGVEYGPEYVDYYRLTPDRWASLAYRELKGAAQVSLPLEDHSGLHLSFSRVIVAANGPKDAMDLSLGFHRYFPPR